MQKVKVGIIGATGYAGLEIVRLLLAHPFVELTALSSVSYSGKSLSSVYPSMAGIADDILTTEQEVIDTCDVVFASLPHGLSQPIAAQCRDKNRIFIDLGADFRLYSEQDYQQWYGENFLDKPLQDSAVYAIPELFRKDIAGSRLIANPGCYPTSVALALAPLIKSKMIETDSIIIDAKSGVTGAGRSPSQTTHFPDCNEGFSPYKVAQHRHTPEIEQTLSVLAGCAVTVTFVPHLLPVNRGILSTIYAKYKGEMTAEKLDALYKEYYKQEKFVRILPSGSAANIKNVTYSNYCDISLHLDSRCGRVVVVSAIDNMLKGAAGQAVQNMNIVCGFPEDTALNLIPPAF